MSAEQLTVASLYRDYEKEKASQIERALKKKKNTLSYLYDSYADDYRDPRFLRNRVFEAIDNGLTETVVFKVREDIGIYLYDTEIEDLFMKKRENGAPSLCFLLERYLSAEWKIIMATGKRLDPRTNRNVTTVEVVLSWDHVINPPVPDEPKKKRQRTTH